MNPERNCRCWNVKPKPNSILWLFHTKLQLSRRGLRQIRPIMTSMLNSTPPTTTTGPPQARSRIASTVQGANHIFSCAFFLFQKKNKRRRKKFFLLTSGLLARLQRNTAGADASIARWRCSSPLVLQAGSFLPAAAAAVAAFGHAIKLTHFSVPGTAWPQD